MLVSSRGMIWCSGYCAGSIRPGLKSTVGNRCGSVCVAVPPDLRHDIQNWSLLKITSLFVVRKNPQKWLWLRTDPLVSDISVYFNWSLNMSGQLIFHLFTHSNWSLLFYTHFKVMNEGTFYNYFNLRKYSNIVKLLLTDIRGEKVNQNVSLKNVFFYKV